MNRKMIFRILGNIIMFEGAIMLLPFLVSLIYKEHTAIYFIITAAVAIAIGYILANLKTENRHIYAKEGFIIVALSWVVVSLVGALPFYISGEISNYIDAFFCSTDVKFLFEAAIFIFSYNLFLIFLITSVSEYCLLFSTIINGFF